MAFTDPSPGPGPAASVAGAGLGCLFFIALLFPIIIVEGMGHCAPDPCPPSNLIAKSALLALGPAVLLGAALRSLLRWLGERIKAQEPGAEPARGPTPWWAFA